MQRGMRIAMEKDGVHIEFGQDERGACTVCVTGAKKSERELRQIGEEVAGRVVQQFAYHKLMTELKRRNYSIVEEQVMQDQSIQVRVRL
jgi:queuine/archaeosine tRNA-ribosyltransferase